MICVQCNKEKSEGDFRKKKRKCKPCEAYNAKLYRTKNNEIVNEKQRIKRLQKKILMNQEKGITENTKQCNECHLVKNLDQFSKGRHKCLDCIKIQDKNRYNKNKPNILTKRKNKRLHLLQNTKKCTKCKKRKNKDQYHIYSNNKHRSYCISCGRSMCKNYKAQNRDNISQYNKEYKQQHKEEIRKYNREWTAKTKKTNPQYKIKSVLRIRLNKALQGLVKSDKTLNLLGCDLEFLLEWFKFRFINDMTIDNHGEKWHIDHVIPCSSFDLTKEEEQKKCFHWTNLQPLEGTYNIIKGDKIDQSEILNQKIKVQEFLILKGNDLDNKNLIDHINNINELTHINFNKTKNLYESLITKLLL